MPFVEIKDLTVEFRAGDSVTRAVDRVSLSISAGEVVCIAGESGCGKTVTALSLARLLPAPPAHYAGGEILLDGRDVLRMSQAGLRRIRGSMVGYIFQEPASALNPVRRVGAQILESLRLHRPEAANEAEVVRLLRLVGIPAPEVRARDYPHTLSGGMQQRVLIAAALAARPKLLVADEPTTALDVTLQAQILTLLLELKRQFGMSLLLITHHLGIVREIADRVVVMYAGQVVETGPASEVLQRPRHPYTRALRDAVPHLGAAAARLRSIPGSLPSPDLVPIGCRFQPRCALARPECAARAPDWTEVEPGRWVRCPYGNPDPPEPVRAPEHRP
jgi:oligopeptide/dipeptide ABC transporter ATP-binding protein